MVICHTVLLQAQFTYITSYNQVQITGYRGTDNEIVVPASIKGVPVTSIGGSVFSGLTNLTSVTIPNSVIDISWDALLNCPNLKRISVDSTNPVYSSLDGVLFARDGTILVTYPASKSGDYTIPDSVTIIGGAAFFGCTGLNSVKIPDSVTLIGGLAFAGCTSLNSVRVPDRVTEIGDKVFSDCSGLTSITIPNSVTRIGFSAFSGCTHLEEITIPKSVTYIGENALSNCPNLKTIKVDSANPAYGSVDGVLFAGGGSILVRYPPGKAGGFTIPPSVTTIGIAAFSGCTRLNSATIPNSVISIQEGAFYNCSSLTNIFIPNSVNSIGGTVFSGCTNLNSVTISSGIAVIGLYTFSGCTSLTNVVIPNSVTYIGGGAFSGCTGLNSVTIPNSVTRIGGSAFSGCTSLKSIVIPNGVTTINNSAFSDCFGLKTLTIPSSVTEIGDFAFSGCSSLSSIHFLGNAPYVGHSAFVNCDQPIIYFNSGTLGWYVFFGDRPTKLWDQKAELRATNINLTNGLFGFDLTGSDGQSFVLEVATDLVQPLWKSLSTNTVVNGKAFLTDPAWENFPTRFYRVRVP